MAFIESIGLLLPAPRPTKPDEVASAPDRRAVREFPHNPPSEMAIQAGRAALAAATTESSDIAFAISRSVGGGPVVSGDGLVHTAA